MPEGETKKNEDSIEVSNADDAVEEEKIDKSLDEVSNVIHDLLTEPKEEDTDEKVDKTFSEAEVASNLEDEEKIQ